MLLAPLLRFKIVHYCSDLSRRATITITAIVAYYGGYHDDYGDYDCKCLPSAATFDLLLRLARLARPQSLPRRIIDTIMAWNYEYQSDCDLQQLLMPPCDFYLLPTASSTMRPHGCKCWVCGNACRRRARPRPP